MASIEKTGEGEEAGDGVQTTDTLTLLSKATIYGMQVAVIRKGHNFCCSICGNPPRMAEVVGLGHYF